MKTIPSVWDVVIFLKKTGCGFESSLRVILLGEISSYIVYGSGLTGHSNSPCEMMSQEDPTTTANPSYVCMLCLGSSKSNFYIKHSNSPCEMMSQEDPTTPANTYDVCMPCLSSSKSNFCFKKNFDLLKDR